MTPFVARWDLDKTYLRTEFDTLRDLVRTALETPEQKRTVPGAATLLCEIAATGAAIHILSGSPEQMRGRIEKKLRLDGVRWDALTLKPNLQNLLHFRLRALRDQLGYKLPALLGARAALAPQRQASGEVVGEVLLGDDSESDAFVYSLYADVVAGRVGDAELERILVANRSYAEAIVDAQRATRLIERGDAVERILIHLDRQRAPRDFEPYAPRLVPFYNYLQAAFVLQEDGRLTADSVLRVAADLVVRHRFDGDQLLRSYLDLARRGHLDGTGVATLGDACDALAATLPKPAALEIERLCEHLGDAAPSVRRGLQPRGTPDYLALLGDHSLRRR